MSLDSGPEVRVQLQVQMKDSKPKEIIRKVTSTGYEIVECDGFVFARKRKAPPTQEPQPAEQPAAGSQPTNGVADVTSEAPAPGPQADNPLPPEQQSEPAGTPAAPAIATANDAEQRSPLNKKARVDTDAEPSPSTPAAATSERGDQQEEQVQEEEQEEEEEQPQPPPRERDLVAEVSSLTAFVPSGCPTALKVTWLLQQALQLAVPPGDDAAAAAAESVLAAFKRGIEQQVAAAQQLLQAGGPEELRQFDSLPPMVREMCSEERVAAGLRQRLAALEAEETAWLALEARYRDGGAAAEVVIPDGADAAAAGVAAGEGEARDAGATGTSAGPEERPLPPVNLEVLEKARQLADVELEIQVDHVNSMLGRLELLLEEAEEESSLLQADYHKENFFNRPGYVHLDSPNVLLRYVSQPAVPAAPMDFVPSTQPSQG